VKLLLGNFFCKEYYKRWIVRKWRLRPKHESRPSAKLDKSPQLQASIRTKRFKEASIVISTHRDLFWKVRRTGLHSI
jgi:hypothetical protein